MARVHRNQAGERLRGFDVVNTKAVGKRRVKVVDEDTGEEVGRGVLQSATFGVGADRLSNESEIVVAADLPVQD